MYPRRGQRGATSRGAVIQPAAGELQPHPTTTGPASCSLREWSSNQCLEAKAGCVGREGGGELLSAGKAGATV